MRIVVLDGYALNPGDLSWDALGALGDCEIHDRTRAEQIIARAEGASALLTNKTPLDGDAVRALSALKYVGVLATGYNIVDVAAAAERGVVVTNVPAYGARSVAQMTFALLLELAHHVGHHAQTVRDGRWTTSEDFCYWDYPLIELEGLTIGIVGLGRIGRTVAGIAQAFGMDVLAFDVETSQPAPAGVRFIDLDELFAAADVVSLHCPLTPQTDGLVSAERLARMKPSAFLLNTSRGPIVDQRALADALNGGALAGAGLDVLAAEPPTADNALLTARNCLITPHISWATRAARQRLMDVAVANVEAFVQGRPQNVVN